MFDIGFFELVIIFVLGLLVLGPERLPRVARGLGRWIGKARRTARNLQYELQREIDLEELRKRSEAHPINRERADGAAPAANAPPPATPDAPPHAGTSAVGGAAGGSPDPSGAGAGDDAPLTAATGSAAGDDASPPPDPADRQHG